MPGPFALSLCRGVPEAVEADVVPEICQRLRRHDGTIHAFVLDPAETLAPLEYVAPWSAEDFEAHVLKELERFSDEEAQHWLEHGRGPVDKAGRPWLGSCRCP